MANGATTITEAPSPPVKKGALLIATTTSLISAGAERMLAGFGRASYLAKARQQPEKVRIVLEKIKTDGLLTTLDAVRSKLAQPLPLGYCNVGGGHRSRSGCHGLQTRRPGGFQWPPCGCGAGS